VAKISIVTPSYNMADFIETTLLSVITQNNVDLEYIVVDGMSTDKTSKILDQYGKSISHVICEEDEGQYYAIKNGFSISTGEIMGWINADDIYMPWTLSVVSEIFDSHDDVDWIIGNPGFINERGQYIAVHGKLASYPRQYIQNGWYRQHLAGYLQQESMFWRRRLWEKAGGLDLSLNLAADFKLWVNFAKYADLFPVNIPLAAFRKRPGQQRSSLHSNKYNEEVFSVCKDLPPPPLLWNKLSSLGKVHSSVARAIKFHKTRILSYSDIRQSWVKESMRLSISRVHMTNLILEYMKQS